MLRSVAIALPKYDAFLFASIGEEENGMSLSVLSTLARLDIDPWREATELARMSTEAAEQRLTSLIAALPDRASAEAGMIAARLITLLPCATNSSTASRETSLAGIPAGADSRAFIYAALLSLLFMVGTIGAQWAAARIQPPARAENAHALAARAVFPQTSRPGSGR